jgi:NAD(P)-dependent dehydrogenase (short-subunit alcohol dehydrogenase family)
MSRLFHPDIADAMAKAAPIQHFGEIREIADATIYLLPSAGGYVNGMLLLLIEAFSIHEHSQDYRTRSLSLRNAF